METDRVIAFRSHWGYKSEYCTPASGHEKGGVEGELGWFRRDWLVPVPEATMLEALNQHMLDACLENRSRTIIGRNMTIGRSLSSWNGTAFAAAGGRRIFDWRNALATTVDGKGWVKVKTNWYSCSFVAGNHE